MRFKPGDLCIDLLAAAAVDSDIQRGQAMIVGVVGRDHWILAGNPPRLRHAHRRFLARLEELQK